MEKKEIIENNQRIDKEISRCREDIEKLKNKIKSLTAIKRTQFKDLNLNQKVVVVAGEKAKDWIEDNSTLFPKKELITHEKFEEYRARNDIFIERIILLEKTDNYKELISFAREFKRFIEFVDNKLKRIYLNEIKK